MYASLGLSRRPREVLRAVVKDAAGGVAGDRGQALAGVVNVIGLADGPAVLLETHALDRAGIGALLPKEQ